MRINYQLTASEFMEGQRVFCRTLTSRMSRFNYRYAVPVGLLLIADGIALLLTQLNLALALVLLVWGLWMIVSRTLLWPLRMKKEYAQYPDFDRSMEFSEQGFTTHTIHGGGELRWSRLTRFVETEKLFVLFAPPRMMYMVPKRALSSGETDQFRELLRQHVPTK
ncbi:MAG: YcxB family protein [Acidobacteriia bacterium]|nr:YcxB family protein [Terriglobia bacterium]